MALKLINDIANTTFTKEGDNYIIRVNKGFDWKVQPPKITGRRDYASVDFNDNMTYYGKDENNVNMYYSTYSKNELNDSYPLRVYFGEVEEKSDPQPEPEPELNVKYNLEKGSETHTYEGGTATINITISLIVDFITENVKATYKSKTGEKKSVDITLSGTLTKVTGSVSISDVDTHDPIVIDGDIIYVTKPQFKLTNCRVDPPLKEYYKRGESFTARLVADEGNKFTDPNKVYLQIAQITGRAKKYLFDISPDKQTATITYTTGSSNDRGILIYGEATTEVIIEKNYGAINAYVVTTGVLDAFAKKRFVERTGEEVDLGVYVNRIKRIFTNVPTFGTADIVCGNYNTEIQATKPTKDSFSISFGEITIPIKNGDNTDYESDLQLFLPFVGLVSISSELMGVNVSLTYEINVITGKGVARLSTENIMLYVWDVEPSTDVLYRTANKELQLIGRDSWEESYLYGLEPYILIKWYTSLNVNDRNSNLIRGEIGGFTGLNSFTDITTISAKEMLTDEQQQIYSLLNSGVYII